MSHGEGEVGKRVGRGQGAGRGQVRGIGQGRVGRKGAGNNAVSGLPDPCSDHARCIAHLALDMMDVIKNAKSPRKEKSNCQVGDYIRLH